MVVNEVLAAAPVAGLVEARDSGALGAIAVVEVAELDGIGLAALRTRGLQAPVEHLLRAHLLHSRSDLPPLNLWYCYCG